MTRSIARVRAGLDEWLVGGLGPLARPVAELASATADVAALARRREFAWRLRMKLHSAAYAPAVDERLLHLFREATHTERQGRSTGLWSLYDQDIANAVATFRASPNPDPTRLIGNRIFVAKGWKRGERGVVVIDINQALLLFHGLFDVPRLQERYLFVLEPGWNGYCTSEVLSYTRLPDPVVVQTIEPRDEDVLRSIGAPFVPAYPVAANWWIDDRQAPAQPAQSRDIDLIMIAAWARYKRHARVFQALKRLRQRGRRLRVVLVGAAYDLTAKDISDEAKRAGIGDQIEMYEHIPPEQVGSLLSRSKLHVLWSLREGSNRAIVEAMLAGVPTIVRSGFNFGHAYRHINPQTGRFVEEGDLAEAILDMLEHRNQFSPREWVLEHMTCHHATRMLEEVVCRAARTLGEPWTEGLVVKTSHLYGQRYWNPADRARFDEDYRVLASTLKT